MNSLSLRAERSLILLRQYDCDHTLQKKRFALERKLLNPDRLSPEIEKDLFLARKTKSLWARQIVDGEDVETLEGRERTKPGDYLCRGIEGEVWPQKKEKLLAKFDPSGVVDDNGWERFDPKPDIEPVEATQIDYAFSVKSNWGILDGKPGDFVVRSTSDPNDIWIVKRSIFIASYDRVS